ncbi:SIS domain-containing protein [Salmonella enterica subsp. enterica serovar Indiana]|jgi:fructoselysine-6-P-deglycase FrlB-like protein|uniref:SIS domain-containing protein n=1 Tax=Enterobacteriaceae TaxID=543 RepID=UPI0015DC60FA|nr:MULTISPECIES: SIS domain-containing protein [Enterobacteriaceae]MBJ5207121.1 SIS domain-containing protein [Salmonella enterica subsp. enterica serovar Indiana]EHB5919631.1 SIS domain-containing protein [Escherichia coli]EHC5015347.1 SIS domain-containing protein [Escherichia coli]MBY8583385.1 SIS domain-containing protein [Escherichia coli]MCC1601150.1 SIS domain-containing protein [Salmonella enterica subsp. enterica serovar Indiana]
MNIKEIIEKLAANVKDNGGIRQVFLVACGGSLVDMYPAKYFFDSEATTLHVGMYTANEFVYATPKTLSENSLVIVCSHGGNTPESVAAAKLARAHQAQTVTLTHNEQAKLIQHASHNILYAWGNDTNVVDNPMAIILSLCVEVLNQVEGYAAYADFQQGMEQINGVIAKARQQVADRCQRFARRYQDEKLFYILSSGASYGHAYGFAICSLMEMQWLHAAPIHSGEYFHGPFEVTDKETPFILLMNEGRTRVMDERANAFLSTYAEKVEVVDAKELGIGVLPPRVVEFFNPVLFYSIMCEYRSALADIRQHPLETRRYMGQVAY